MECLLPIVFIGLLYVLFCVLSKLSILDSDSDFNLALS